MAASLCHLCATVVSFSKNAVSLFSSTAVKQLLSSRIEHLLDVAENDALPQYICEKCKRRVETLERAIEDLRKFQNQGVTYIDCTNRKTSFPL